MNCEIREAFSKLDQDLIIVGRYSWASIISEIRSEIEADGYYRRHKHDLVVISKNLKTVNHPTLSKKLQSIIDSLGEPEHRVKISHKSSYWTFYLIRDKSHRADTLPHASLGE